VSSGAEMALEMVMRLKDELSDKLSGIKDKFGDTSIASAALGVTALGGVVALTKGLVDCGKAAGEEQVGIARLSTAVTNSGGDWSSASDKIEKYLASELKRTALDDGAGRESLARLVTITKDVDKSMDLMSIAQDMAAAKGIPLATATEAVGKAYMGNDAILKQYGVTAAAGVEPIEALRKAVAGQAEAYGTTLPAAQARYETSMGNIKETIGAAVLPAMTSLLNVVSDFAANAIPAVQKGIDWIIANKEPIVAALLAMGVVIFVTNIPALVALAGAAWTAASGMIAMMAPVVLPVLAIGIAVGVLVWLFKKYWTEISDFFTGLWDNGIKPAFEAVRDWFTVTLPGALDSLVAWFNATWAKIDAEVRAVWAAVVFFLEGTWASIRASLEAAWNAITTWLSTTLGSIRDTAVDIWDGLVRTATDTWESIRKAVVDPIEKLWTQLKSTWDGIKFTVTDAWRSALDTLKGAADTIWTNVFETPLANVKAKFEEVWNGIKGFIGNIFSGIHIPLPHFNVNWSSVLGVSIPSGVSVDWYGAGGDFVVRAPTLIGVGENGAERVTVQPLNGGSSALAGAGAGASGGNTQYVLHYYHTESGPQDPAALLREMEMRKRMGV
jgi:hypothetical protein